VAEVAVVTKMYQWDVQVVLVLEVLLEVVIVNHLVAQAVAEVEHLMERLQLKLVELTLAEVLGELVEVDF
jgi:hypothetical protein